MVSEILGTSLHHQIPPNTTPLHPGVFGNLLGVLGYLMGVLGYLMAVLGYLMGVLGYPMAWRRRQAMAKWRWGPIKWREAPTPGPPGPRHFIGPKRHLAMAWRRRRQAMAK